MYRPGSGQPVGRRVHQRPSPAESHPPEDRRTGGGRSAAVRHLAPAARLARLCVQDLEPLPGDGQHPAGRHRRLQAQSDRRRRREEGRRLPARQPQHLLVGGSRQDGQGINFLFPPKFILLHAIQFEGELGKVEGISNANNAKADPLVVLVCFAQFEQDGACDNQPASSVSSMSRLLGEPQHGGGAMQVASPDGRQSHQHSIDGILAGRNIPHLLKK